MVSIGDTIYVTFNAFDTWDNIRVGLITLGARGLNEAFKLACQHGNVRVIHYLMKRGVKKWDVGFEGACRGNQVDVMQWMLNKGASHLYGLNMLPLDKQHLYGKRFPACHAYMLRTNARYRQSSSGASCPPSEMNRSFA